MKKVYIYKTFERFWHWNQAALIIFLAITGFEVHGSIHLFGYEAAVTFHRVASYLLLGLIVFAIFWHFTTGEWKQYLPTTKNIREQIRYYSQGIFKNEPHPGKKTGLQKLNPLQVWVYLGFKILIIPVMVVSGLLYMFHKQIDANDIVVISEFNLEWIALWHTLGAWLLVSFIIVHVYMTTTGHSVVSNIKAMITGYEEQEDDENLKPVQEPEKKEVKNNRELNLEPK
jgi:thiosulfate reductase cytochrome b subunit